MFSALPSEADIAGERHHPSGRGPFLHQVRDALRLFATTTTRVGFGPEGDVAM
jgi:hypothetical protein